jgi:hypothetical protein
MEMNIRPHKGQSCPFSEISGLVEMIEIKTVK